MTGLPEHGAAQFARFVTRQAAGVIGHPMRAFVRCNHALDVLLQLRRQRLRAVDARSQHHMRADERAAPFVDLSDDGTLGDRGMAQQRLLHFAG